MSYLLDELREMRAKLDYVIREMEAQGAPEFQTGRPAEPQAERREFKKVETSEIRDPLAKSMTDLVTPKQLGMIRALSREAGVDADEECQIALHCKTEDLSKRAASAFIDHLKGLREPARRAS